MTAQQMVILGALAILAPSAGALLWIITPTVDLGRLKRLLEKGK